MKKTHSLLQVKLWSCSDSYSVLIHFLLAIFINAYNPLSGYGWKGSTDYLFEQALVTFCKDESGDKLIKCVEDNVYMARDIFISDIQFKPVYKENDIDHLSAAESNQSLYVQYYVDNYNGMALVLYPEPGIISKQTLTSLQLTLNNTIFYYIVIGDPNFMFNTIRPDTFPITLIKLEKGTGLNMLFLKVQCFLYDISPKLLLVVCLHVPYGKLKRPLKN